MKKNVFLCDESYTKARKFFAYTSQFSSRHAVNRYEWLHRMGRDGCVDHGNNFDLPADDSWSFHVAG